MNFPAILRGLRRRVLTKEVEAFCFPLPTAARIALLDTGFRAGPNMRMFGIEDIPWMRLWAPEALVLPLGFALSLSDQKRRGLIDLPSLNTAIVVLTTAGDSPLAEHHRDLLWRAFGVPVFEQLRGSEGAVIARECEVHDGLHLHHNEAFSLSGELVTDHCACGSEAPRLRALAPTRAKSAFAGH